MNLLRSTVIVSLILAIGACSHSPRPAGSPESKPSKADFGWLREKIDESHTNALFGRFVFQAVLMNAMLLYHDAHGRWPQVRNDLEPYIFDLGWFTTINVVTHDDQTATVYYAALGPTTMPADGGTETVSASGSFTIRPEPRPRQTTTRATHPAGES